MDGHIRRRYKNHTRLLTPTRFRDGYDYATISYGAKGGSVAVHRLVAKTFLRRDDKKTQVNHKNGNKTDNCLDNLEWVTPSENIRHAYANSLILPPHEKRVLCCEYNKVFKSIHAAGRFYNVSPQNISACCRNKLKSTGGLHWRYA